jgi:crotonobetainyl-CoA:carnitine CoA-transferase CaiB-like acyl-CoA transferase
MGAAPQVPYRPTPERGQHTGEVLAEFGYSVAEIDDLMERGVV